MSLLVNACRSRGRLVILLPTTWTDGAVQLDTEIAALRLPRRDCQGVEGPLSGATWEKGDRYRELLANPHRFGGEV